MSREPFITVIVPAHEGGPLPARCLGALGASSGGDFEIVVADDASEGDAVALLARRAGARLVRTPSRSGPAAARNLAARGARGAVLLFVDSDVEVCADTVSRVAAHFRRRPELAAVFGSYDDAPAEQNFVSQYKNLLHHFVHQQGDPEAETFWAGCGAVRRDAFERVCGFDAQRFPAPSVEDIELGYRLRRAGYAILLDRELQVKHLKRWTLPSLLRADILSRAAPWSRLILERRAAAHDLNLRGRERVSAALVGACVALAASSVFALAARSRFAPALLAASALPMVAVFALNRDLFGFFRRRRGALFASAAFPLHALYYFYSGATFALCWLAHKLARRRAPRRDARAAARPF